jgi:hypothetical protein
LRKDNANIYSLPKEDFDELRKDKKYLEDWSPGARQFADNILDNIKTKELPYVISVEGDFGTGKTHFITRFCEYVKDDGISAVYIDAFRYCYLDPFFCITKQLTSHFKKDEKSNLWEKVLNLVECCGVSVNLPLGFNAKLDLKQFFESSTENAMQDFKQGLQKVIGERKSKQLVLIIDELDRCPPNFSIRLLETLRHFFDIEGLFTILSLNYKYFIQSLKGVYGSTFGDDGSDEHYIDKFVDSRIPMYVSTEYEYEKILKDFLMGQIPAELLDDLFNDKESYYYLPRPFWRLKLSLRQSKKACEEIVVKSKDWDVSDKTPVYKEVFFYLVCRKILNTEFVKYNKVHNSVLIGGVQIDSAEAKKMKEENENRRKIWERCQGYFNKKESLTRPASECIKLLSYYGLALTAHDHSFSYDDLYKMVVDFALFLYKSEGVADQFAEAYLSEVFKKLEKTFQ